MPLSNELVQAAYAGDLATVENILLNNIDINAKADYPLKWIRRIGIKKIDYPAMKRFQKLHTDYWRHFGGCEENLNTFTPLAAAIFGKQQKIISWILDKALANTEITVTAYAYGDDGYLWPEKITNLNMLDLALIVGDTQIIEIICQHLKDKNTLQTQVNHVINLKDQLDDKKLNAFDILEKLNDLTNLKVLLGYLEWTNELINETLRSLIQRLDNGCSFIQIYLQEISYLISKNLLNESILQSNVLTLAFKKNKIESCKYFISLLSTEQQKQALMQIQNYNGCTLLNNAITLRNITMVKLLCLEQDDINLRDKNGNTALHNALLLDTCPIEIINTLLKYGAEIDIKNNYGKSALDLCRQQIMKDNLINERARLKNTTVEVCQEVKTSSEMFVPTAIGVFVPTAMAISARPIEPRATAVPASTGCCLPMFSFHISKKKSATPNEPRQEPREEREFKTQNLSLT